MYMKEKNKNQKNQNRKAHYHHALLLLLNALDASNQRVSVLSLELEPH